MSYFSEQVMIKSKETTFEQLVEMLGKHPVVVKEKEIANHLIDNLNASIFIAGEITNFIQSQKGSTPYRPLNLPRGYTMNKFTKNDLTKNFQKDPNLPPMYLPQIAVVAACDALIKGLELIHLPAGNDRLQHQFSTNTLPTMINIILFFRADERSLNEKTQKGNYSEAVKDESERFMDKIDELVFCNSVDKLQEILKS
ncbi:MAG TPA: hypothetical protein VI819_03935 [Patescibacteria group bacterium]|nr:hypothetical protein [Patescibacteria group bacterium]